MDLLLEWTRKYSPPVVALLVVSVAIGLGMKLIVERAVTSKFDQQAVLFQRRSTFDEMVLTDRYRRVIDLSARLERVMTNLNRIRTGGQTPEGFSNNGEIVPLTEIFEELTVHRLSLGERFYDVLLKRAFLAIEAAEVEDAEGWKSLRKKWGEAEEATRRAAEAEFGLSKIQW